MILQQYLPEDISYLILENFDSNTQCYLNGEWDKINNGDKFDICHYAISHGFIKLLLWASNNGNNLFENLQCPANNRSLSSCAALFNKLDLLKWLRIKQYPWDGLVYCYAAEMGHLHILEWAYNNGCPKNDQAMFYASRYNNLECCQWLLDHGFPWSREIIKELSNNYPNIKWEKIYRNEVLE